MEWSWIVIPLGIGLIVCAALDVFLTVLHIQAESPLSDTLNNWLWQALLLVTRRLSQPARDEILGWGAPLMIGGIILVWAAVYVVGFSLLYLPFVHDPAVFSVEAQTSGSAFADALYFSSVSFFTLGYGDIVALHPIPRFLGIVEGGIGLLTISLSVTYLLSVYPLIARKETVALSLNQESGGRADGLVLAERYVAAGRFESLGERLRWLNDELLTVGHAHGLYPVLYYVRPREVHQSFVRTLAVVQGLIATLRYGLDPAAHHDVVTDPRLRVLEEGLLATLHTLADSSHLDPSGGAGAAEELRADFTALCEQLATRGVTPIPVHDGSAFEAYARFRDGTDPYIRGYAGKIGYPMTSVRGGFSRRARGAALAGPTEPSIGHARS